MAMRFVINPGKDGRYLVKDMINGRYVRFGYNNPPLYATATNPATRWQNYHAALGFCQKMDVRNDPLPWKLDMDASRLPPTIAKQKSLVEALTEKALIEAGGPSSGLTNDVLARGTRFGAMSIPSDHPTTSGTGR